MDTHGLFFCLCIVLIFLICFNESSNSHHRPVQQHRMRGSVLGLFLCWLGNPDLMNPLTFFSPEMSGAEEPLINNNL